MTVAQAGELLARNRQAAHAAVQASRSARARTATGGPGAPEARRARGSHWNEGSAFQVRYAGRVAPPLSNVSASPQS
jgi:hypothetical protein